VGERRRRKAWGGQEWREGGKGHGRGIGEERGGNWVRVMYRGRQVRESPREEGWEVS